jgi:hypothetical protein
MDKGGFTAALLKDMLKFNGKLFKGSATEGYSLLLTTAQIDLLILAAQANWREVEPAIFGTLLERALDPAECHALGAHYTPRAYVERLVLPTVIEPLRAEWANAQAAALLLAHEATELEARAPAAKTRADFEALSSLLPKPPRRAPGPRRCPNRSRPWPMCWPAQAPASRWTSSPPTSPAAAAGANACPPSWTPWSPWAAPARKAKVCGCTQWGEGVH